MYIFLICVCSTPNVHMSHLHYLSYLHQSCLFKLYGVLWPSPKTAYNLCLPNGVVLENLKKHLRGNSSSSIPAWSVCIQPAAPFKGLQGGRERRKKERRHKPFSSLIGVSLEQMDSGLPALKMFPLCVVCWEWPQHYFLSPMLLFNLSAISITKLLVISNYRSF